MKDLIEEVKQVLSESTVTPAAFDKLDEGSAGLWGAAIYDVRPSIKVRNKSNRWGKPFGSDVVINAAFKKDLWKFVQDRVDFVDAINYWSAGEAGDKMEMVIVADEGATKKQWAELSKELGRFDRTIKFKKFDS